MHWLMVGNFKSVPSGGIGIEAWTTILHTDLSLTLTFSQRKRVVSVYLYTSYCKVKNGCARFPLCKTQFAKIINSQIISSQKKKKRKGIIIKRHLWRTIVKLQNDF